MPTFWVGANSRLGAKSNKYGKHACVLMLYVVSHKFQILQFNNSIFLSNFDIPFLIFCTLLVFNFLISRLATCVLVNNFFVIFFIKNYAN